MEPVRLAEAALAMQLRHVVVTSVTRDDLPDGGASVFAETIRQLHAALPGATVEVLIPDFKGDQPALRLVMDARPEILGHNVETVSRLYQRVRPQALYHRSLETLKTAKKISPGALTKSGVMVGLGEDWDDLLMTMTDLRRVDCDILTIGQYLRPSKDHLLVSRYYTPEQFATLKEIGYDKGFRWVESGPFVRSSYHAEVQARELGNS
jgi:lipoic acid synthetase